MLSQMRMNIGQRMLVGFEGTTLTPEFRRLCERYGFGNFILFSRNLHSKQQIADLCGELHDMAMEITGLPPIIATDQEGGNVRRLPEDCSTIPAAAAIAHAGGTKLAFDAGLQTGRELLALGINMDLAPVADVNVNDANPVIGVRSFGSDPHHVSAYVRSMIDGLHQAGCLACAKHFPGHGDTAVDSHLGLPIINKSLSDLKKCELVPFYGAISHGVDAIMTAHILFPKLEPQGLPATMSAAVIEDLLRHRLGYDGLVITDCLMMKAVADHFGSEKGAMLALNAGVDLACVSHDPELAGRICEKLYTRGNSDAARLSVERIITAKSRLNQDSRPPLSTVGCASHRRENYLIRRQSLTRYGASMKPMGDAPLFAGCMAKSTSEVMEKTKEGYAFAPYLSLRLGGSYVVTDFEPSDEDIERVIHAMSDATSVVLCTVNAHTHPAQKRLLDAVCAQCARRNLPLLVCAMRDPQDVMHLPDGVSGLAVYEYSPQSMWVLYEYLQSEMDKN